MPSVGNNIKLARQKKNMTQDELASAIEVTKSAISKYELDHREPGMRTLQKIARVLDTDIFTLIGYRSIDESTQGVVDALNQHNQIFFNILNSTEIPDSIKETISSELPLDAMTALTALSYQAHKAALDLNSISADEPIAKIATILDKLNLTGQQKAVERVEELTEIPKYQKPPEDKGDGEPPAP